MKIPQLEKKPEIKSCHNTTWEDNYSWIHQSNILDVLKDSSKLLPEVRKYLEKENDYFEYQMNDTKEIRKKIFNEIKGRIKLDDESLPYKDKNFEYWTKTTTKGNYSIKLRRKIGEEKYETFEIDISDDLFLRVAKQAHERDITFNVMVHSLIKDGLTTAEYKFEHENKPQFLTEYK